MKFTRRKFLSSSIAGFALPNVIGLLSSCANPEFIQANENIILGGSKFTEGNDAQTKFALSIVNLKLEQHKLVPIDFLAHGIILDPLDNHCLVMFEKIGPGACEVDMRTMTRTRKIIAGENRYFYGHGAFSHDGLYLYSTETYLDSQQGVIAIRDAATFQLLGEFPTYGSNPHECQLVEDGKVMVITNGGRDLMSGDAPSVTYVDVDNQQLLERVVLNNKLINTGHMGITDEGALIVVSAPRSGLKKTDLGGVSIKPGDGLIQSIAQPEKIVSRMIGEALSVVIHEESGICAVTHPDGNMVTFWSIADGRLLKNLDFPKPRGVSLTLDEKYFVLSYGPEANLTLIKIDGLIQAPEVNIPSTYITGSHIYNWSKALSETDISASSA
jgi:uncharacterized protein